MRAVAAVLAGALFASAAPAGAELPDPLGPDDETTWRAAFLALDGGTAAADLIDSTADAVEDATLALVLEWRRLFAAGTFEEIAAFQAGDGERAYGHAAPAIKRLFPSVAIFMRMVEQGYEPVFRPKSFAFIDQQVGGDDAVQYVDLVGPDGAAWIAMYTLRRQPDGSWKITGCRLKPATGV